MPLYIQEDYKLELLSAIFSAIAYGIVVVLSGNCFHLIQKKWDIYPNRMRILLPVYITVMLLSSTWRMVGSICEFMDVFTPLHASGSFFYSFALPITVTMWGADGFMIWRCLVLYRDVSRGLRVVIIVLLSLLSFASFVCGVLTLVQDVASISKLVHADPAFISLSALLNIILAALIVFRLVYHQRYVRDALGLEHKFPYTNIITMCVESSALMVIVGGLYIIVYFVSPHGEYFMFNIIPHICVISPLLIVNRVAIGRAIPPTLLPSEQVMA